MAVNIQKRKFKDRVFFAVCMLFGFIALITAGHLYASIAVMCLILRVTYEILELKRKAGRDKDILLVNFINWYFVGVTLYYSLGTWIKSLLFR